MVEAYAHPKDGYNGALGLTSAHWTVGSMTDVAMGILLVEDRYYVISDRKSTRLNSSHT